MTEAATIEYTDELKAKAMEAAKLQRMSHYPEATIHRLYANSFRNVGKFKVGDEVVAVGNYRDEQLGQFAYTGKQQVLHVRDLGGELGTSGQWIKTNMESGWIDSAWFNEWRGA